MDRVYLENKQKYMDLKKTGGIIGFITKKVAKYSEKKLETTNVISSLCIPKCNICPKKYSAVDKNGNQTITGSFCCHDFICKDNPEIGKPWCDKTPNGANGISINKEDEQKRKAARANAISKIDHNVLFDEWKNNGWNVEN